MCTRDIIKGGEEGRQLFTPVGTIGISSGRGGEATVYPCGYHWHIQWERRGGNCLPLRVPLAYPVGEEGRQLHIQWERRGGNCLPLWVPLAYPVGEEGRQLFTPVGTIGISSGRGGEATVYPCGYHWHIQWERRGRNCLPLWVPLAYPVGEEGRQLFTPAGTIGISSGRGGEATVYPCGYHWHIQWERRGGNCLPLWVPLAYPVGEEGRQLFTPVGAYPVGEEGRQLFTPVGTIGISSGRGGEATVYPCGYHWHIQWERRETQLFTPAGTIGISSGRGGEATVYPCGYHWHIQWERRGGNCLPLPLAYPVGEEAKGEFPLFAMRVS